MSREPDPLFQNNVFQQLVANSNAEATEFFDSSMFGGLGAAGFGMGFGDENEGIEAGQILQSLSAAEGPMRGRRNRWDEYYTISAMYQNIYHDIQRE